MVKKQKNPVCGDCLKTESYFRKQNLFLYGLQSQPPRVHVYGNSPVNCDKIIHASQILVNSRPLARRTSLGGHCDTIIKKKSLLATTYSPKGSPPQYHRR